MFSHGLCDWYSQPMLRDLHNSYSSQCWPTLRFFLFDMLADGRPVQWSAVHEMYHPAVCDMMGGPASFLLSILDQWKAVWYAGFQQYIKHICNLSISVKAAPLMISGASNGPSSCLQYDEGTTMLLIQYLTSMESYDVQDSNSTSYCIYV